MSRAELFVPTNWRMSSLFSSHWLAKSVGDVDELLPLGLVVGRDVVAGEVLVVVVDAVEERLAHARCRGGPRRRCRSCRQVGAVDELGRLGEARAADAGTTRVDQQRPDARRRVGGEVADEVQPERAGVRVGVVDRDLQPALLEPFAERGPLDRLRLERRQRAPPPPSSPACGRLDDGHFVSTAVDGSVGLSGPVATIDRRPTTSARWCRRRGTGGTGAGDDGDATGEEGGETGEIGSHGSWLPRLRGAPCHARRRPGLAPIADP